MRLTNTLRDAFVRAAMDDVPAAVDYTEAIRKAAVDDAVSQLPASVQAIWHNSKSQYLKTTTLHHGGTSIVVPASSNYNIDFKLTLAGQAVVDKLVTDQRESKKARGALSEKLRAVAYSVTTRKALVDALPEFEKYLPADEAKAIRTLPVVANVVADFMKAGWPKDKVPA